ncbi:MAG: GNAT family N-acetyltransferase [Burkholderiales bacterium]|nr:GNAT family N-acetyltransferase [Burkholderiales bacterium]
MPLEFRDQAPEPAAFKALYDHTGWGARERPSGFYGEALAGSWACCAVYEGSELVGFGRVISDGRLHAYVNEMIVLTGHQGRGIGREILQRLLARCRAAGITDIQLFAARGRAGFYAAEGFQSRPEDAPGMQYRPPLP